MAKDPRRINQPSVDPGLIVLCALAGLVVLTGLVIDASLNLSHRFTGQPAEPVGWNPIGGLLSVASGKVVWTPAATIALAVFIAVILAVICAVIFAVIKHNAGAKRVDKVQKHLAGKDDTASLSRQAAESQAKRWLPEQLAATHPGLRFGHLPGHKKKGLYSSWEDLYLVIFGPRMGKTTTQVIPAIVDAPGPVVTTSNKRDIVDDTVALTSSRGRVFVFDPQRIAAGFDQPAWFFDPLDMVRRDPDTMDSSAVALADIFLSASKTDGNSGGEQYWENMGRELMAAFLLAAALDDRPISDVYRWVTDPNDRTALSILTKHDKWSQQAAGLKGKYATADVTRSGFFSQAAQMAAPLSRAEALKWVTPRDDAERFSPEAFVRSTADTVYILSKEGADNAAALTTALTAAIMTAAEKYGEECGGRLPVPLVAALDEAANVVRWPQLPSLYSHYGSRSIILMTILQSYAQGVNVWGEQGMEALWSASNITLYGGGVRDDKLLQKMESLVGEAAEKEKSVSSSKDGRSTSTSYRERKILTVADLAALQAGRAVVFASKRRPLIAELEPFWERDWDDDIRSKLNIRA